MKKAILFLLLASPAFADLNEIKILPLDGPVASVKISPPNGSAGAYRMDYPGQKAVCFQNNSSVVVYIGSSTVSSSNGYPLSSSGTSICMDLRGGTTVYMYGDGASADIRAIVAR